jgi:hypothetical protein
MGKKLMTNGARKLLQIREASMRQYAAEPADERRREKSCLKSAHALRSVIVFLRPKMR